MKIRLFKRKKTREKEDEIIFPIIDFAKANAKYKEIKALNDAIELAKNQDSFHKDLNDIMGEIDKHIKYGSNSIWLTHPLNPLVHKKLLDLGYQFETESGIDDHCTPILILKIA